MNTIIFNLSANKIYGTQVVYALEVKIRSILRILIGVP